MSLTIFLAPCILSLDFMIYVLFKLLYGDRRSTIARRVAAHRKVAQAEAAGLIFVPAPKPAPPNPGATSVQRLTCPRRSVARNSRKQSLSRATHHGPAPTAVIEVFQNTLQHPRPA